MTQVIIPDVAPYTQATAILNQTVFSTNWTANFASDVVVYQTPFGNAPDDATQILAYPATYSVAFIGDQLEVQVTLVTPAGAGDIITITRMTPADRENLYSNTNFTPSMLNNDFGILTLVDQQAQLVNQLIGPRYNYSAIIVNVVDTILPILGANQGWVKNSGNTAIIPYTFPASGIAPAGDTYITVNDETATLPNSTSLAVVGEGILVSGAGPALLVRSILGMTNQIVMTNGDGIGGNPVASIASNPIMPGTAGMGIPEGTTAQRVTPLTNIGLRYNTDDGSLEYWNGSAWVQLVDDVVVQPGLINELAWYAASGQSVSGLATIDNGVLLTSNTGVPTWLANSSTPGYVLTANSGAPASWQSISSLGAVLTIDGDAGSVTPTAGVVTISGGSTGLTTSGSSSTLDLTGTLAIGYGGTNVTSVTISPTATAFAGWDANKNLSANNFLAGYTTTATAASTTTLTVGSTESQFFTGSTTQTVLLPVTSTLVLGQSFYIVNNSSGVVTVQSSGGNLIQAMASGTTLALFCILTSGTTASSWYAEYTSQTSGANFPLNTNITSMTGLTGVLQAPTFVNDTNGNHVLGFTSIPSAVNYLSISNQVTGLDPILFTAGSDSAIGLFLGTKNSFIGLYDTTSTSAPVLRFYNSVNTHFIGLQAGTLSADTTFVLPTADGTSGFPITTDGSGNWSLANQIAAAALPTGTMFNFQFGSTTAQASISSNNAWVDLTGVSVAITPTSSSDKVLVRAMISGTPGGDSNASMFRLVRTSTAIGVGVPTGSQTACSSFVYTGIANNLQAVPIPMEWLDAPATTSATTYKVQYFSAATQSFQLNNWNANSSSAGTPNGVSTISVCQIKS